MVTRIQVSTGLIVTVVTIGVTRSNVFLVMAAEATRVTHHPSKVTKVTQVSHRTEVTPKALAVTMGTTEIGVSHHLITDRRPMLTTECQDQTVKADRMTTEVTVGQAGRQATTENVYQV
jgi:hypothetical protein